MTNVALIIFSDLFLTLTFTSTMTSIDTMYLKRTFVDMPNSVLDNSIKFIHEDLTYGSYFDKTVLENDVIEYLKANLKDRIDKFRISFNYYTFDDQNNAAIDLGDYPKNVNIHFIVDYKLLKDIGFYRSFEISSYE